MFFVGYVDEGSDKCRLNDDIVGNQENIPANSINSTTVMIATFLIIRSPSKEAFVLRIILNTAISIAIFKS